MKKLFPALALAVVVLAAPVYASDVQIQIMGMNWQYDGSGLFDGAAKNTVGSGMTSQSDPLDTVTFYVDGTKVGSLTTNIWFDSYINVGTLAVNGTKTGSPSAFGFDLLTRNATPGWGLALQVNSYSITTATSGSRATLSGSFLDATIYSQNLPFGIVLTGDPVTVSFSGTIYNPVKSGGNYTSFTAAGTGEMAATGVPAPAALLLFAPGLAGLAALRRRMRK